MISSRVSSLPLPPALVLGAWGVLCLALPAPVLGSVLPLDPPLALPGESEGHGPAQVALRDDGGFVSVWVDVPSGRSTGRWFGHPATDGTGEFELMPEGSVIDLCGMERSADGGDRYLAAWRRAFGGSTPQGLVVRPFDGEGRPLGPPVTILETPVGGCTLTARPGGGWALAWWGPTSDSLSLLLQFLDPAGRPEGRRIAVEDSMDRISPSIGLAAASSGRVMVSWGIETSPGQVTLFGSGFGVDGGELSRDVVLAGPIGTEEEEIVLHDLAAVPGPVDSFLFGWAAPGDGIQVRPYDLFGNAQGAARRLDRSNDGWTPTGLAIAAAAAGSEADGVVAWSERDDSLTAASPADERLVARLVEADGVPRSETFEVLSSANAAVALDGQAGGLTRVDVARDGAGRLVFGWGLERFSDVIPSDVDRNYTNGARRFRETAEDCGPVLTVDFRTEPTTWVEGERVDLVIEGLADCAEVVYTGGLGDATGILVQAVAELQACGTFPPFPYELRVLAGPRAAGPTVVELEIDLPDGGVCFRRATFDVEPRPEYPPVPDRAPLTSPELPGFRVWADITPRGQATIAGTRVAECLPEVLCVAGALPGRAEVFVRVIGPRPNGFLWPVLVQLTPSEVEVWMEQIATGEVNYYRLEAPRPGMDDLDGLFDRGGFVPQ
jgi:hypothetical protein